METRKLPVGVDDFEKLRNGGFYYIDKTAFISDLLRTHGEVNLFTRPRRFGKTLNMTMLKAFLEIGTNPALFEGLAVSSEKDLCEEYLGKYPVVSITLKSIDAPTFDEAMKTLKTLIAREAARFTYILDASVQNSQDDTCNVDVKIFNRITGGQASIADIKESLLTMSILLSKFYGKKVIVLIDEYDVPLDKAFQNGYYKEMLDVIRGMLGQVLKSNSQLYFAVLTGALRISKESIFTGLNNLKVDSISDYRFDEYFGFTDEDVKNILEDYDLSSHYAGIKEWYNGYHFGDANVYNPWDVISYCDALLAKNDAKPQAYWINTSGNELVKRFVDKADATTRNEIERLIAGESISKVITQELTYSEIDESIDNLWSILFMTGYLTTSITDGDDYRLVIPNREVRDVFINKIKKWFAEKIQNNSKVAIELCDALRNNDINNIEAKLNSFLVSSISYHDYQGDVDEKEGFYHALVLALLKAGAAWAVYSNIESGDGLPDLLVESDDLRSGMVVEFKYADSFAGMEKACNKAMEQIVNKRYAMRLWDDGVEEVIAYGISFYKKRCKVVSKQLSEVL
ncbi:hypothetical protein AGMMS49992_09190 [Clostridia bacterium]|nr:hypothetical protein AGMMS49992_09190 [Clostridia bacterium]